MHVYRNNSDLHHGKYKHSTDDAQKAKDVVIATLVLPQASEHEEQLDEYDGKRNKASEQGNMGAFRVPDLIRNLPRNSIGLGRMLPRLATVITHPASNVHEGNLDEEPEGHETDECAKGHGGAGGLGPDKEIQDEHDREEEAGEQEGRL